MDRDRNIYNYKPSKEMNEETHYFLPKGRITPKAFWLRILFAATLIILSNLIYEFYFVERYDFWLEMGNGKIRNEGFKNSYEIFKIFNFPILPLIMIVFILIQSAKRMHDVNKSGWLALVPIYNLILIFSNGTSGNNNYGVDPKPLKKVKYFDELEKE